MTQARNLLCAIAVSALLLTGCSSASPDERFIGTLRSHGLHPPAGMSDNYWERLSIDTAHSICDLTASGGLMNRDQLVANSIGEAKVRNEAAVSIYCPGGK
jgi:hypothetical protein